MKINENYTCTTCLNSFPSLKVFKKHVNKYHFKIDTSVCLTCYKKFRKSVNFYNHLNKYGHMYNIKDFTIL